MRFPVKQSDSITHLAAALAEAQAAFPVVGKDAKAQIKSETGASFQYRYATLPDIQAAIRPVLKSHGLAILQGTADEDEGGFTVVTQLVHVSGEWVASRVRVPIAAGKHGPTAQAAGSAFAYGRRIGLVGLLGVVTDDEDDDGAKASEGHGEAPTHQRVLPPKGDGAELGTIPSKCPKCGGKLWDNRQNKTNPKAPDWKCRDKACVDERGYVTGGWAEKPKAAKPSDGGNAAGPGMDDEIPLPEDGDDLPY
jgi:hypothetical protein